MKLVRRSTAVVAALAAGALFASGCSSEPSCAITPPIHDYPTSCTLPSQTTVDVNIRWCNCGSRVVCDVTREGNSYFLEPRVTACDAECPGNPESCDIDSLVTCAFTTPEPGTYFVTIADGLEVRSSTFTVVASGGDDRCDPPSAGLR
ncbi:MAG TPA: hypothetical protein VEB43_22520 [Anaeromyxobacter sp.]|nr:hypothetical protein [Anaeromyxobacter sp.]